MTKVEMLQLLVEGGIDVEHFDSVSTKTLQDLFLEICERDVELCLVRGRVQRVAVRADIIIKIGDQYVRQIERIYAGGRIVRRPGIASISETRKRDECLIETVRRGMREECGLDVDSSRIRVLDVRDVLLFSAAGIAEGLRRVDEHPSSVYEGVTSVCYIETFEVRLDEPFWDGAETTIEDNGVRIRLGYWKMRDMLPPMNDLDLLAALNKLSALS